MPQLSIAPYTSNVQYGQQTLLNAVAALVPTVPNGYRSRLIVRNIDPAAVVWYGFDANVTNLTGAPLNADQEYEFDFTISQKVYFYNNSGASVVIAIREDRI